MKKLGDLRESATFGALLGMLFGLYILDPAITIWGYVTARLSCAKNFRHFIEPEGVVSVWDLMEYIFSPSSLPRSMFCASIFGIIGYVYAKKQLMIETLIKMLRVDSGELLNKLAYHVYELQTIKDISVGMLASISEYHDKDTGTHIQKVGAYVRILISGLRENCSYTPYVDRNMYAEEVVMASLLRDIGKVGVSKEILTKPNRLTQEEFASIKTHTVIAGEILGKANQDYLNIFGKDSYLALARDIALYHHEKWDGSGYPIGLTGEKIPLSARIVALADVYDALASERSYKKAWSHEKIVEEITICSGKHFDPLVVGAFLLKEREFREVALALK